MVIIVFVKESLDIKQFPDNFVKDWFLNPNWFFCIKTNTLRLKAAQYIKLKAKQIIHKKMSYLGNRVAKVIASELFQ